MEAENSELFIEESTHSLVYFNYLEGKAKAVPLHMRSKATFEKMEMEDTSTCMLS